MVMLEYQSAVYTINRTKSTASKFKLRGYPSDRLPAEMPLRDLATLLASMQQKCFQDANIDNENTDRLMDMFSSTADQTIAVVISLGYEKDPADYRDFADGGSATIQKSRQGFLPRQQPWINEVCRSKLAAKTTTPSPIKTVMEMIEKYVLQTRMKRSSTIDGLYLYVEKKPAHGNPAFLVDYYSTYGYSPLSYTDDEYFYMHKKLTKSPTHTTRKAKRSVSTSPTRRSRS